MKTKKEKKKQMTEMALYNNYEHQGVKELIDTRIPEIRNYSLTQAVEMAEVGRPSMLDTSLPFYTSGITSRVQLLADECNQLIGSDSAKAEGVSLREGYMKEEKELTTEIAEVDHDLRKTNKVLATLDGTHGQAIKNKRYATIAHVVLSLGETMINISIFNMLTDGVFWKSVIAGISMTVLLMSLPFVIHRLIKRVPNVVSKIAVAGICTAGVVLLLSGVADMRIGFMNANDSSITDHISKSSFVLFNTAYFITSLLLVIMYHVPKEVIEEHKEHQKISKRKGELEIELKHKKERLKAIPEERKNKLGQLYAVMQLAKSVEQVLESHHQSLIEEYIKKNMVERVPDTEGKIPPVFLQERPKLVTYHQDI